MNKRFKIKTVGRNIHIVDSFNFNKLIKCFDISDMDEAEIELATLNESFEIRAEIQELESKLN